MTRELIGPVLIIAAVAGVAVLFAVLTRRKQRQRWREMNDQALRPK